ncbi:lipoyl(octanoyl) transferase LipB [Microbacterium sp. MPKO10]|uniref:lipoyl(octanoyl) transferase LipB n=1 Tax=Microbacterium sp. MPKO10 TaxID=2989818 RepID=UPI002235991E|nr:lipoyl(octanoyl) transferase LipB [Microbacterium sp. MPKO10]MCW4459327.1 lipoyl(octanoyl) transferase LipB [Microbacterium sp. MPKO10]
MLTTSTLGLAPAYVPYLEGWEIQRRTHRRVADGLSPDTLLLLEHEAVYTAGKRTEDDERPDDGTPVIDVDRGGKITWHGPGQLVGYPIVRLADPVDVVAHVRTLERALIDALTPLGVEAVQVSGRSGVWVRGADRDEKIAAIGVRVAEGVTMHGFAVNCDNDLGAFEHIIPCGIRDAGVTSVSEQLGYRITPADLADSVSRVMTAAFNREEAVA